MNDHLEDRFGYLNELTREEKLNLIELLENDIMFAEEILNDKKTTGDNKRDLHNDILFDKDKLKYLKSIVNEKHL